MISKYENSTKCIQTLKCVINSAQFHIFFHIFNNIKPHILLYEMFTKQCNAIEVDVQSLQM